MITGLDYVRAGLLDQARLYAAGKSPNYNAGQAAITKGMLALLAHRPTEASHELTRGLELMVFY